MTLCGHGDEYHELDIVRGLLNGLLLAIPLWAVLAIVPALALRDGTIGESTSSALMVAAVCEYILARPYLRVLWARLGSHEVFGHGAGTQTRAQPAKQRNDRDKHAGQGIISIEDLLRFVESKRASKPRPHHAQIAPSLLRQSLALSALAAAYLQYYFLEVHLEISSLSSLTVFLPLTATT